MLITLSGLDGSGKSTLIRWLQGMLEAQQRAVVVRHMHDDIGVYACARSLRDGIHALLGRRGRQPTTRGVSRHASDASAARGALHAAGRRVRHAILWNKSVRRLIYPIDVAVFLVYRWYVVRLRQRVLIMDRYFYDTLVDVWDVRSRPLLRLLYRLTPTPTLPIYLDVPPEISYARKQEYSIEYLHRRSAAYRAIFPWVREPVVIPNVDFDATTAVLERAVRERILAT